MRALVVSYLEDMTSEIIGTLRYFDENVIINVARDTWFAKYLLKAQMKNDEKYDVIVMDAMVQETNGFESEVFLKPVMDFLRSGKITDKVKFPKKVFVLFDTAKTGSTGKTEVKKLGYTFTNYYKGANQWKEALIDFLKSK